LIPDRPRVIGGDVILVSTADWDNPHWTNKQHLAVRLGRRGMRVLYLESLGLRRVRPRGADLRRIIRRFLAFLRGPRPVAERVWVFSPLQLPFPDWRAIRVLNRALLAWQVRILVRVLRFKHPVLWIFNPLARWLKDVLAPAIVVYQCVDDLTAVPGVPSELVRQEEVELVQTADLVIVTSRPLLEQKQALSRRIHLSENTVDYARFATALPVPTWLSTIPSPRLGYVGAISSYKVNLELLAEIAENNPTWQLVLVGTTGEGDPDTSLESLHRMPNIHLFNAKPYDALPGILRGFDVCLLPRRLNKYTEAMFPMKFFEYCATGKPVVLTPLPALKEYWRLCYVGADVPSFERAVVAAMAEDPERADARREAARLHDWEPRVDAILAALGEVGDPSASLPTYLHE